ncbi:MAG: response regulator transcription factor [Actinomycetota bacterium]|nr:response regulator transcription factor [Actinomycetota bacterium]
MALGENGSLAAAHASDDDPIRVVLVDDTEEIRRLLRIALELDGRFRVIDEAGDGASAVKLVGEKQPDAVVLDLAMPIMDGLQAIPEIRERAPGAKILVLSGFGARQMSNEAMSRGADAYVEKGGDLNDLATKIISLVET